MTSKEKLLQLAAEGAAGKDWYRVANTVINEFCYDRDICPEKFVKILAVTSPQVSVQQNLHLAVGIAKFQYEPKLMQSIQTSLDRLRDAGFALSAIKGPKTSRFARALLGDGDAVVLDTHMGYALKVGAGKLKNKSVQAEAEKRIKWVAKQLGWEPAQAQAAIWMAQRARAGYADSYITRAVIERAYQRHREHNPF